MIIRSMDRATKLKTPHFNRERSGPYDKLYSASPDHILWGPRPSRLVTWYMENSSRPVGVLDIGCGDGVNALALERVGASVVGVDVSEIALEGLQRRFTKSGSPKTGTYLNMDVDDLFNELPGTKFDCLVSCGLFQCLPFEERVCSHRSLFDKYLAEHGTILFSCLTNEIALPTDHSTLNIELVSEIEIAKLFRGYKLIQSFTGLINDSHFPIVGPHRHSIHWTIATR